MKLLVVSNSCSAQKYNEICRIRMIPTIDPQQKFFRLMITGLGAASNDSVSAISALPVSATTVKKHCFRLEHDFSEKNVKYTYLPFFNGRILRYITLGISAYWQAEKWCRNNKSFESAIILDPLVPMIAIPTRIAAKRNGIPVIAVVTDIPTLATNMKGRRESKLKSKFMHCFQRLSYNDIFKYDAYIPLTQSLNEEINVNNKPFLIVEGFADSTDNSTVDEHENYIMYAGGVYEKYGVKALVDAFKKLDIPNIQLYIFGEGPYVDEIKKEQECDSRIRFMGCVSPEEVVDYEKRALLLVNPRPVNEKFAQYSFPSKTMEYLLSGTPVVSTRLPGIPNEYFEYMFSFNGDDSKSIKDKLELILKMNKEELIQHGRLGHAFVINKKNNKIQASRIVKWINSVLIDNNEQ